LELDPALRNTLERESALKPAAGALVQSERERIVEALQAAKGQRARAARLLGISRATLYRKLKEFEIG
jgi:transcriptional regulator of acetoin/glycerol metabolism